MSATRLAVAGIGMSSPLGDDVDAAWDRLCAGDSGIVLRTFDGLPAIPAAVVAADVAGVLGRLQQVGTERVSQMALGAARRALSDAGLVPGEWADPERVGLYVGTGMGGAATIDAGYAALHGGRSLPPMTVPAGMVNGAAGVVAMHLGIRGPVVTYSVACASSAVALAEAAHALRRGEIDVALVGGAEAILARGTVAAWRALRTLAPPGEDVADSCRPFARDRAGLVLGEGAAFLVLRRDEAGDAAGGRVRAWLRGASVRCDAAHLTTPQVRGQVSAMRAALADAGLAPEAVGHCNAHGTGTVVGDPVECAALREVWGDAAPRLMVSATKAAHGHLLGAAGTLEAAWTILALQHGVVPPTRGVRAVDPDCDGLDHVLGEARAAAHLRFAVSNSFAFGGTNVALVFEKA